MLSTEEQAGFAGAVAPRSSSLHEFDFAPAPLVETQTCDRIIDDARDRKLPHEKITERADWVPDSARPACCLCSIKFTM